MSEDALFPFDARPLLGHGERVERLLKPENRRHPAWILAGEKGIGKAKAAFHVAARLLSRRENPLFGTTDEAGSIEPDTAALIRAGSHPDLMVLQCPADDGRKTISIDHVRRMTEFLTKTPAMGGWRVAILDALDELGINAANAMLKTLEEPPGQTMLLLVAHTPGAILPTIRSRCRMMRFDALTAPLCREIIEQLYPDIDPAWCDTMAGFAKGSPGKAALMTASNSVELYADTCLAVANEKPDATQFDHLAAQWGAGGIKNHERRYMAMLLFDRLLSAAALEAATGRPEANPVVPVEAAAIGRLAALHHADELAARHDRFLDDWRQAERYNTAMPPLFLRLMLDISQPA